MPSFGFKLPIFLFAAVSALAQTPPSPPATPKSMPANASPAFDVATIKPGESGTKHWKFAVVSIRKNNFGGPQHIGVATADGYQMKNLFLGYLLWMAYVPPTSGAAPYSPDQFIGMPAWLTGDNDRYDVDAKIDEADLADWQDPAKQPAMLRSMLQAMLEDRLKLVVHRSVREAPVYLLVGPFRNTAFAASSSAPDIKLPPCLLRRKLDTPRIIKEELNSARVVSANPRTGLGARQPIQGETCIQLNLCRGTYGQFQPSHFRP